MKKSNEKRPSKRWYSARSDRTEKEKLGGSKKAAATREFVPIQRDDLQVAQDGSDRPTHVTNVTGAQIPSQQQRPGAYAVEGPGLANNDEREPTSVISQDINPSESIDRPITLDACLAPENNDGGDQNPLPLFEAIAEVAWWKKRKNQVCVALVVLVAVALGVVLGIVLGNVNSNSGDDSPTATPQTLSPVPTMAPTTLSWAPAGEIVGSSPTFGVVMTAISSSNNSSQFAISDGSETQVWQETGESGEWRQVGQTVPGGTAVSLASTQLLVDGTFYQFVADSNEWTPTGLTLPLDTGAIAPWDFDDAGESDLVAVDLPNEVRVYQQQSEGWASLGEVVPTMSTRAAIGNTARRTGLSVTGNNGGNLLLLVESTVYTAQNEKWVALGVAVDFVGTSSTISRDGSVVAIADAGKNANGIDSGEVKLYFVGQDGLTLSTTMVGDRVSQMFGVCLALSSNGRDVAILSDGEAGVFRLKSNSNSWRLVASVLPAEGEGAIVISSEGQLVAISGGGRVRMHRLQSST